MNEHQQLLKKFNISLQQFNILRILRGQYPQTISLNSVKDRMLDKSSDVSRLVDRLVKKNLIDRTVCPSDRRQVNLLITEKGLSLLENIDKIEGSFDQIVSGLTQEEAKTLNQLLDKLEKH
ncbi:MarR family transcriptional regulator [bacterium]|nr:MarR family transcriptional regulator [bacterium]